MVASSSIRLTCLIPCEHTLQLIILTAFNIKLYSENIPALLYVLIMQMAFNLPYR